jgi:hypothetical protein
MQQAYRWLLGVAAVLLASVSPLGTASALTDQEVREIFRMLDTNGDGKITREEYSTNIVKLVYSHVPKAGAPPLTFEQTRLSRAFFDAADADHDGTLSPLEIMDALPFELADTAHKGYIDLEDMRRVLARIAR